MKIRVCYSELISGPCYNNRRAEAELEVDVTGNLQDAFTKAWQIVKDQVKQQLKPEEAGFEAPF